MANQYTTTGIRKKNGKRISEYAIWVSMKQRCLNPNCNNYHHYGGRGIKICDRWINSFENFIEDMGIRPSNTHSLDRFPNNDGDYTPENCRWATKKEQANNTRVNSLYTYNGVTKTMMQWSEEYKLKIHTLCVRLVKHNWPIEKALTTPSAKRWSKLSGEEIHKKALGGQSLLQIAKEIGCDWATVKRALVKYNLKTPSDK